MYSKDLLHKLYVSMLRIRICEESLVDPILRREIRCPCHLYSGQEAVAVGVCTPLSDDDYIFGTHRSHGHYLAKGGSLRKMIAEIYGKETGCSGGRGGSMHLIEPERGIMGAVPIVAGTISLALGAALALKIRKSINVTVSFFGDGATGEGVLYESLNFASLKKLPMIFVCENNLYSTHMPIDDCRTNRDIYKIGIPFDIYSIQVDGNNVLDVYDNMLQAIERCRQGNGPVLMECRTYRLRGHVGADDTVQGIHTDIRPLSEIEEWRRRDPIKKFKDDLVARHVLTQEEIEVFDQIVEDEIKDAYAFSADSPYPDKREVERYVFK
jgi:acetoin:2,6-dichlorophenolindophenol oxidoreductase subunit alpha